MAERVHRLILMLTVIMLTLLKASADDPAWAPTPGDAVKTFWSQTEIAEGMNLGRFNLLAVEGISPTYDFETSQYDSYNTLVESLKHYGTAPASCGSNLKTLGTALDMYCTDNVGQYPTSLNKQPDDPA